MGFIDKIKNVANWESAIVIIVTILSIVSVIIIGAYLSIEVLYIGGLIALGIPTSFFGNLATKTVATTMSNPATTEEEHAKAIAELSTLYANLKTEIEEMNKALNGVNEVE